jgi:hypothetical protein
MPLVLQTDTNPGASSWEELSTLTIDRPSYDDGSVPTELYVNSVTGSDATGDGTVGNPYATFYRAYADLPTNPIEIRTVFLQGAGPYESGAINITELNNVTIRGDDPVVDDTRTITSIGASSEANGLVLTDADAAMVPDEHRGKLIQFTDGPMANTYGTIASNTAQTVTVISGSTAFSYPLPAVTNSYQILDWVTVFTPSVDGINLLQIGASTFCTFQSLRLGPAPSFISVQDSASVSFVRCRFEMSSTNAIDAGSMSLDTCSVANTGNGSLSRGMVGAVINSTISLRFGTFVDGVSQLAASVAYVSVLGGSLVRTEGEIGFRELGNSMVVLGGASTSEAVDRIPPINRFDIWRFFDCDDPIQVFDLTMADLPDLYGALPTATEAVTVTGGAFARLGSNSNLTTATNPNAVSVDGSTTSARGTEGSVAINGDPAYQEYTPAVPGNWAGPAPTTLAEALDRLAAANPGA